MGVPFKLEPSLEEILSEPIIQLLMKRDRVTPDDVRGLMKRVMSRSLLGLEPEFERSRR
jgi:hypothetical protein